MGGVVGVIEKSEATQYAARCLHNLQHRGHGGGCLFSFEREMPDGKMSFVKGSFSGLVSENLIPKMEKLRKASLSSTAYAGRIETSLSVAEIAGSSLYKQNSAYARTRFGEMGVVLSGYIREMKRYVDAILKKGASMSDTNNPAELISHMMSLSGGKDVFSSLPEALKGIDGRFAVLVMTENAIVAARDPYGMEPLSLYGDGHRAIFASESCAFPLGADFVDIRPGTVKYIGRNGETGEKNFGDCKEERKCFHELVWGSRPDSKVFGLSVSLFRRALGMKLAELYAGDFTGYEVVPVPDSAMDIAEGVSAKSPLPLVRAIQRTHYQRYGSRTEGMSKLQVDRARVPERALVVEDSANYGDTGRDVSNMLRQAGAKSVYMLSATPPRKRCPCMPPPKRELLGERFNSSTGVAKEMGLDGFYCLGVGDMLSCVGDSGGYCMECFSGMR